MKKLLMLISGFAILISTFLLGNFFDNRFSQEKIIQSSVDVYPVEKNFIQAEEVEKMLKIEDSTNRNIVVGELETKLSKNDYIDNAEVYKDLNGNLVAEVYQYRPIARVMGNTSYYIDDKGRSRPLSTHYTENVILIFGNLNPEKQADVFTLLQQINNDKYLSEVVTEIHLKSLGYTLKLKGNKAVFQLGTLEQVNDKLLKLKAIYTYLEKYKKQTKYSDIDLRYRNQVVCK